MAAVDNLRAAYEPLIGFAMGVDEDVGWLPTRLPGWTVRDLLFHLASDAQRALVALGTPADGPPDTDAVSYWRPWRPGTEAARSGLRGTRIMASAWSSVRRPADLFTETARAVLVLSARADPDPTVLTQQRRLSVDGLLGTTPPPSWDDVHYALAGTGRLPLTPGERDELGSAAGRFLLFALTASCRRSRRRAGRRRRIAPAGRRRAPWCRATARASEPAATSRVRRRR